MGHKLCVLLRIQPYLKSNPCSQAAAGREMNELYCKVLNAF